jgi:hypothetical protein
MSNEFVLAKVSNNDIVFVAEEDSEETRCLRDAKIFNKEERENFSFIPLDKAKALLRDKMAINS